jgi:protein-S-isoprenylcysteine O-methyltransferase Ste14
MLAAAFAWLGALVFAASLLYFVYFYFGELGRPPGRTRDVWAALVWNTLLFGVFASHHSLMARSWAKRLLSRVVPPSFERSVFVWVASALFFVTCRGWSRTGGELYRAADGWAVLLAIVQIAGGAISLAGSSRLDVLELAGVRQAGARPLKTGDRSGPPLLDRGLYRLVRHPIYLGWVLLVFAAPVMTVDRLMFATVSTAYVVLAIRWEERSLRAEFGDRYARYQRTVRWRLVPLIY